jgi:uncharacterized OsmC-like protein
MEEIVKKVETPASETSAEDAPSSLKENQDRELRVRLTAESLEDMKKRAVVTLEAPEGSTWSIWCDEGAYLGGDDTAPPPLVYFSAAVAFWLLTQLSRYGKIAKLNIESIHLEQVTRFFMKGSALDGTMRGGGLGLETHIAVESDESPEQVRKFIQMGEQTCFTLQSLIEPVPTQTYVKLNGEDLPLNGDNE